MDFPDQLAEHINSLGLSNNIKLGYLDAGESFVMYPLPGSQVIATFFDGVTDQELNYEIAMQSKSQKKIHETLWTVQTKLEQLQELESEDGSFEFQNLIVTNKPFVNQIDEQGWFVFLLDIQAKLTIY